MCDEAKSLRPSSRSTPSLLMRSLLFLNETLPRTRLCVLILTDDLDRTQTRLACSRTAKNSELYKFSGRSFPGGKKNTHVKHFHSTGMQHMGGKLSKC